MAISIEFGTDDLRRTRIAGAPDVLWEVVLSVHTVQVAQPPPRYRTWQQTVRERLRAEGDPRWLRPLLAAVPPSGNFPDFLTPGSVGEDIDTALDRMTSTPPDQLAEDLAVTFAAHRRPPRWALRLAAGDHGPLLALTSALRRYYEIAVAPYLAELTHRLDLDRSIRARQLLESGLERMLDNLNPEIGLHGDQLVSTRYPCFCDVPQEEPGDGDQAHRLQLAGRGITLVPAHFSWGGPVKLINPERNPVLVYPADADVPVPQPLPADDPLGKLIGRTRARLLRDTARPSSTTDLARHSNLSPSTVSEHMAVLRAAGLVTTRRTGLSVTHTLTTRGWSFTAH